MHEFASKTKEQFTSLHKYFLQANSLKLIFDKHLNENSNNIKNPESNEFLQSIIYMSIWYAALYVVIEGFEKLNFNDSQLDIYLSNKEFKESLRQFRNKTLHYQEKYWSNQVVDFFSKEDIGKWINNLHASFSGFFLNNIHKYK